jgi:hypothetical protein
MVRISVNSIAIDLPLDNWYALRDLTHSGDLHDVPLNDRVATNFAFEVSLIMKIDSNRTGD